MSLLNVTERGTYAGYIDVAYQQGTQWFTAVFPCFFSFGNSTPRRIYLTPTVTDEGGGKFLVDVSVFNGGASEVEANVSLILPPTFDNASGRHQTISLNPDAQRNLSFVISMPAGSVASYTAAVAASFSEGGLGYASLKNFVISPLKSQQTNFGTIALIASLVAVSALLVRFVYVSIKRKRNPPPPHAKAEPSLS